MVQLHTTGVVWYLRLPGYHCITKYKQTHLDTKKRLTDLMLNVLFDIKNKNHLTRCAPVNLEIL